MFKVVHGRLGSDVWANTRLRIITRQVKGKNLKILDLGCGSGYVGSALAKGNQVIFLDSSEEEIRDIKGLKLIGDALHLPFRDESFDLVLCADVLEHIKEDTKVLENIYNVLKKGGKAIIAVPAYSRLYGHHDKLIGHFRRYNKGELQTKVKKIGFKIKMSRYMCSFLMVPFLFNQIIFKSDKAYKGKSSSESRFVPLLDFICDVESKIKMPFGLGLMLVLEK